jgi:pyrroline-5-carboxylate reductase
MTLTIGIIGVGRLGEAIARRLPKEIALLLADKKVTKAKRLAQELGAMRKTAKEAFEQSDVVLLVVPPDEICPLIKKYHMRMKPNAILVNMASSIATSVVLDLVKRQDIKVVGAKVIGQAYAISKGHKAIFILSISDPFVHHRLKDLFGLIGKVIIGEEMMVKKVNDEATRFGLKLAIDLQKKLEAICSSHEIIDVAIKTVAVGTILEYPPCEPNEYIMERLKELHQEDLY